MNITFTPLAESHFPLLLKWLEAPHVKKWWDQDVIYTMDLVREKYCNRIQYEEGNQPIHCFIINFNNVPTGYIQIYNAYDFPRSKPLSGLPEDLGAFDMFIGEKDCLKQGIGSHAIKQFLKEHRNSYTHIFADPDSANIAAIKCYEKAGFKKIKKHEDTGEVWMISLNLNSR